MSNDNIEVVELTDWKILKNIDSTYKKKHNELLENNEWIAEELEGLNHLQYDSEASAFFIAQSALSRPKTKLNKSGGKFSSLGKRSG